MAFKLKTPAASMVGKTFGRLTVIDRESQVEECRLVCRCQCGRITNVYKRSLVSGNTRSCGCLNMENRQTVNRTHGLAKSPEYAVWCTMLARCFNPNSHVYHRYGGRGITVCDRWRDSFENFYADMGPRPSPKHSIDRENNDDNYSPDNCHWATPIEQANNKATNRKFTFYGKTMTLTAWSRVSQVSRCAIRRRLLAGLSAKVAVWTPGSLTQGRISLSKRVSSGGAR